MSKTEVEILRSLLNGASEDNRRLCVENDKLHAENERLLNVMDENVITHAEDEMHWEAVVATMNKALEVLQSRVDELMNARQNYTATSAPMIKLGGNV